MFTLILTRFYRRWDGSSYPHGLKGLEILLSTRTDTSHIGVLFIP
ncbi:MAG: hypothetical protein GY731_14455 [Gammaproteobacteria bacterium]|nr:hypothetical protein [Gammaproteobacteria bacterium]